MSAWIERVSSVFNRSSCPVLDRGRGWTRTASSRRNAVILSANRSWKLPARSAACATTMGDAQPGGGPEVVDELSGHDASDPLPTMVDLGWDQRRLPRWLPNGPQRHHPLTQHVST
jgi:hypothetical protein